MPHGHPGKELYDLVAIIPFSLFIYWCIILYLPFTMFVHEYFIEMYSVSCYVKISVFIVFCCIASIMKLPKVPFFIPLIIFLLFIYIYFAVRARQTDFSAIIAADISKTWQLDRQMVREKKYVRPPPHTLAPLFCCSLIWSLKIDFSIPVDTSKKCSTTTIERLSLSQKPAITDLCPLCSR